MLWAQRKRKVGGLRAATTDPPEDGGKEVAAEIRRHVPSRLVLGERAKLGALQPAQQLIVRLTIGLRKAGILPAARRMHRHSPRNCCKGIAERLAIPAAMDACEQVCRVDHHFTPGCGTV